MFSLFLQSIHPQLSLTVTNRPPLPWKILPGPASPTQTLGSERRATRLGPWMARRWVWGLASALWGETQTETWEWEEAGVGAQICSVVCRPTLGGHRRAFWTLPTTPAPPPTPAKPHPHPFPASVKQTKASMLRWVCSFRPVCYYPDISELANRKSILLIFYNIYIKSTAGKKNIFQCSFALVGFYQQ